MVAASGVAAFGFSHMPAESNVVSNFVHTQTPFGRGYDYEIGSFDLKSKGDVLSGSLGNKDMIRAVEKHAPDSKILDINKLNNIINDPEFKPKITNNLTVAEKVFLGIPFFDIVFNSVDSDVSSTTRQEGLNFSETSDNESSNTDESTTRESLIKRRHTEPLPRNSTKPTLQRRNTR